MCHVSFLPPTSSCIGILRKNAGLDARHCAARGPTWTIFSMSSEFYRLAWSATCLAVSASIIVWPDRFAVLLALLIALISVR